MCAGWLPHDLNPSGAASIYARASGRSRSHSQREGSPLAGLSVVRCLRRSVGGVHAASSCSSLPTAQMKPASSRATAAIAFLEFFPRAISRRYRLQSRCWARQAIRSTPAATPRLRSRMALLFAARNRYAQAASMRMRRTWPLPAHVIRPRLSDSPLECSDGTKPRYELRSGGEATQVPELRGDGDGAHEVDPTERLERLTSGLRLEDSTSSAMDRVSISTRRPRSSTAVR